MYPVLGMYVLFSALNNNSLKSELPFSFFSNFKPDLKIRTQYLFGIQYFSFSTLKNPFKV